MILPTAAKAAELGFDAANVIKGGNGNDILDANGSELSFKLDGGLGNDLLKGGHGNDYFIASQEMIPIKVSMEIIPLIIKI